MVVKKARNVQDKAILHALERIAQPSPRKWFFVEDIMPGYCVASEVLGLPGMRQSTLVRIL
jgi:hypothetical protein